MRFSTGARVRLCTLFDLKARAHEDHGFRAHRALIVLQARGVKMALLCCSLVIQD
jgi:hypothetical protein